MARKVKSNNRRTTTPPPGAAHPQLFLNRELSWLEFNARVLEEACDPAVPLAERLKFQCIVGSNLDEFFMVRVAGLKQMIAGDIVEVGPDGLSPAEQLAKVNERAHAMVAEQYRNWREALRPAIAEAGLHILRPQDLSADQRTFLGRIFRDDVWPVLTPLAVDQGHPFPALRNRSLNLVVLLHREQERVARRETIIAVVQVPAVLSRLVELPAAPGSKTSFVLLEDVIAMRVGDLFPGFKVLSCSPFRVTRNFDLSIDEEEAQDLLKTIQRELRRRERGHAVRLEIAGDAPVEVLSFLQSVLRLEAQDIYVIDGPMCLADFMPLYAREELDKKKDDPFSPQFVSELQDYDSIFAVIAERDILLHHPYESFEHVVDFVSEAADDPHVLAIKQTLYRTSADSPIVRALIRAAENGKQVTAVVELKARFDEGPNIAWARVLEEAGVHVVYGLVGLKTHCKVALVVRREGSGRLRRYVHLSTGNYNPSTARIYGDMSYFTARDEFADDAGALFNLLTGYSSPPSWKRFAVAPLGLEERLIALIEREASFGSKGSIVAKMNALVGANVIRALYAASQAGVQIDLLVRGICCLRPGVPGTSETIRVTSTVDRFLEHARIFYFEAGGKKEVYLGSADWMPRNFVRRVEVLFPVEDPALRDRLVNEVLAFHLADNVKARRLRSDGTYERVRPAAGEPAVRAQARFIERARTRASEPHQAKAAPNAPLAVRPAPTPAVDPAVETSEPRRPPQPAASPAPATVTPDGKLLAS